MEANELSLPSMSSGMMAHEENFSGRIVGELDQDVSIESKDKEASIRPSNNLRNSESNEQRHQTEDTTPLTPSLVRLGHQKSPNTVNDVPLLSNDDTDERRQEEDITTDKVMTTKRESESVRVAPVTNTPLTSASATDTENRTSEASSSVNDSDGAIPNKESKTQDTLLSSDNQENDDKAADEDGECSQCKRRKNDLTDDKDEENVLFF